MRARFDATLCLCAALQQLHGTLHRDEVLTALMEIIAGLIGSETLAVFERRSDGAFELIASTGIDADGYRSVSAAAPLGRFLASGERYLAGDANAHAPDVPVAAAVPLGVDGRVTGGLVLFSLLAQKRGFDLVDHELIDLLSTHAAVALHATRETGVAA